MRGRNRTGDHLREEDLRDTDAVEAREIVGRHRGQWRIDWRQAVTSALSLEHELELVLAIVAGPIRMEHGMKKSYEKPTLSKRERLSVVTANVNPSRPT